MKKETKTTNDNKDIINENNFVGKLNSTAAASVPDYTLAGMLLLLHTVFYLLVDLFLRSSDSFAALIHGENIKSFVLSGLLTQGLLIFLPTLLVVFAFRVDAQLVTGSKPLGGTIILAIVAGIPAAAVFQGLNNLLIYLLLQAGWKLPQVTSPYFFNTDIIWTAPWQMQILIIIISAFLPAFVEEMMFRGVIQSSLSARAPAFIVIFWQAIAFTLFHLDPLFILPPFLTGLLLGYLRYKSRSLIPPVICHISLNVSLLFLNPLLPRLTKTLLEVSTETTQSLLYASLMAACVAAVALVPLLLVISRYPRQDLFKQDKLVVFPGDWKLLLAMVIMLVTIIVSYYQQV